MLFVVLLLTVSWRVCHRSLVAVFYDAGVSGRSSVDTLASHKSKKTRSRATGYGDLNHGGRSGDRVDVVLHD